MFRYYAFIFSVEIYQRFSFRCFGIKPYKIITFVVDMDREINKKRRIKIGKLLYSERKHKDLRQEDVAFQLGVSQELIAKMESGERKIDIIELIDYCEQLQFSLTQISAKIESVLYGYRLTNKLPNMKYQRGKASKKIVVDISWSDGKFCASLGENVPFAEPFTAHSFAELKKEVNGGIERILKALMDNGCEIDLWLRFKEYEFEYRFMDAVSLLKAYSPYVSLAAISRVSGIKQSQLSLYANGKKKASPQQMARIAQAIHKIGEELMIVIP
jgi:transcriptional regulator with XRE-family HTH domain